MRQIQRGKKKKGFSSLADWEIKSGLTLNCLKMPFQDRGCSRPHSNVCSSLHREVFKLYHFKLNPL
jgi:hypothetical protein